MTDLTPDSILTAVADRVATQVAALGDRVVVGRAPQGATAWDVDTDGPYAVVEGTGALAPDLGGDGRPVVDDMRVSVACFEAQPGGTTLVQSVILTLEDWAAEGLRPRFIGATPVPQPDDVLRVDVEVRYARPRQGG